MAARAFRLGVVVPRSNATRGTRAALWASHENFNLAGREIADALILMRGRSYEIRVKTTKQFCSGSPEDFRLIEADVVQRDALRLCRAAQKRNGVAGSDKGSDKELLSLVQSLYGYIIPSSRLDEDGNPLKGTAQTSCAFAGPLMLPASSGITNCVPIAKAVPIWLTAYHAWRDSLAKKAAAAKKKKKKATKKKARAKKKVTKKATKKAKTPPIPQAIQTAAQAWLSTDQCRLVHMKLSGARPKWIGEVGAGASAWIPRHVKWHAKQVAQATGPAVVIARLTDLGVLPLLDRGLISRQLKPSGLSPWDKMAFKAVCGHLLSWETKGHSQCKEKAKKLEDTKEARALLDPYPQYMKLLIRYETARRAELRARPVEVGKKPSNYHMTKRQVKAWPQLRKTWLKLAEDRSGSELREALKDTLKQAQTEAKDGKFGDPHLYTWLASDQRRYPLWQEASADVVTLFANWRSIEAKFLRKRSYVVYCAPDAQKHPRWCEFEPKRGPSSNMPTYDLVEKDGKFYADVPLLCTSETGGLTITVTRFKLAATRQLREATLTTVYAKPKLGKNGKKGKPKPEALLIDYTTGTGQRSAKVRSAFLHWDRDELRGRSLTVLRDGDLGKVRLTPTLNVEPACPPDWLYEGGKPRLPKTGWHLLSALPSPPDEPLEPGLRVLSVNLNVRRFAGCSVFELVQTKKQPNKMCYHVRDDFWAVHERSFLITLPGERPTASDRRARHLAYQALDALRARVTEVKRAARVLKDTPENRALFAKMRKQDKLGFLGLNCSFKAAPKRLLGHVRNLNRAMSEWAAGHRKTKKTRSRTPVRWLKSMAAIEYTEDCISLYKSWQHMLGASGTDGVFCHQLRKHVCHMKQERVKLGASLVIKAARGIVNGESKRAPCRLILFEDKLRYRFSSDRSRAENRQLMKWCHAEIESTVTLMGEMYGMTVSTVGAGYISQIDARTGAPGMRCARRREFETGPPPEATPNASQGDIVPAEAGPLLVTKGREVNAELNAAWYIQRRFWTRHADMFRVRTVALVSDAAKKPSKKKKKKKKDIPDVIVSSVNDKQKRAYGAMRSEFGTNSIVFTRNCDGFVAQAKNMQDEEKTGRYAATLFRDPSGVMLPADKWYDSKAFWDEVQKAVLETLGYGKS